MLKVLPSLGFGSALGLLAVMAMACGTASSDGPSAAESSAVSAAELRFQSMLLEAYASAGPTKLREEIAFDTCVTSDPNARVFLWNAPEGQWFGAALRGDLTKRNLGEELTVVQQPSALDANAVDITFVGTPFIGPGPSVTPSSGDVDAGDASAATDECAKRTSGARIVLLRCSSVQPNTLITADKCK